MESEITFQFISSMIREQNKRLLKEVAKYTGISQERLERDYLKSEYYLPIIQANKKINKDA